MVTLLLIVLLLGLGAVAVMVFAVAVVVVVAALLVLSVGPAAYAITRSRGAPWDVAAAIGCSAGAISVLMALMLLDLGGV